MLPLMRFKVKDRSMEPSVREGESVIVNRWAYLLKPPARGDLVVLRHPHENRYLLKRIAATEDDRYVVQGDNEEYSVDSRQFGPVPGRLIVGRVLFRVYGGANRGG